jgi:hypothetical protein
MEQDSTSASQLPTIKLLFDGLFFFCFDTQSEESKECQIGVLTTAFEHELSVTIVETIPETRGGETYYKHSTRVFSLGQSLCRLLGHIYINVRSKSRRIPGVTRYGYGNGDPLASREDTTTDPENFKWIIDFENGEFSSDKLTIAPKVFSPVLHINTGEFRTHITAKGLYNVVKADVTQKYFGHVAQTIAANIALEQDDGIFLEDASGKPLWTLDRNPAATYLIHFQNVCPGCKQSPDSDVLAAEILQSATTHEEFVERQKKREEESKTIPPKYLTMLAQKYPGMSPELLDMLVSGNDSNVIQENFRSDLQYYYDAFMHCSGLEKYDFKWTGGTGAAPLICYPTTGKMQQGLP